MAAGQDANVVNAPNPALGYTDPRMLLAGWLASTWLGWLLAGQGANVVKWTNPPQDTASQ